MVTLNLQHKHFYLTLYCTHTPTLPTSYCYTSAYIIHTITHTHTHTNHLPSLPWHLPPPCSLWLSRTPSPPPPQNRSPSHTETWRGGGECTIIERERRGEEGEGEGLTRLALKMKQISRGNTFQIWWFTVRRLCLEVFHTHTRSRFIAAYLPVSYVASTQSLFTHSCYIAAAWLSREVSPNSHRPRAFSKYWIL